MYREFCRISNSCDVSFRDKTMSMVLMHEDYCNVELPFESQSAVMRKLSLPVPEGILCTKEWGGYQTTIFIEMNFEQIEKMMDLEK